jgi:hypothetical protein
MALKPQLVLWSSIGDVVLGSAQAGAIGASFGNGAAQFGGNPQNALQMGDDGNLNVQTVSAGRNPAGTAADYIVSTFNIPAGGFDLANRGIAILAAGSALNASTKSFKIIIGGTGAVGSIISGGVTIASLLTTALNGGWQVQANMFKYGAAGSNTQIAIHEASQIAGTVSPLIAPTLLTQVESAAIPVAVTINAATLATDAIFNFSQIFAMN